MAILRIELLEDCEMNSGRVVNTYYADDVFFDGFGMPYIPSWVIQNSLVRVIDRLGVSLTNEESETFVKGNGSLVLDDALIADFESMRQAILADKNRATLLRNPQTILNDSGFVNVRETSSLNGQSYVRMLAKGTIFESYFEVEEPYREMFKNLVSQLSGLYVGHEVRARFTIDENWNRPHFETSVPSVDFEGKTCRLEYDLSLLSRMTVLDHVTHEYTACSCLTGAMVRESLAQRKELKKVLFGANSKVKISFAYVDSNGKRGLPVPASYSTKKQDKNDLRDRCSLGRRADDYDQIKGMSTLFIDDPDGKEIHAMSVRNEQGLFTSYQNGKLVERSYNATAQGQTFKGFIEGPAKDIKAIYESLASDGYLRMGDLCGLGFGNAFVEVKEVKPLSKQKPLMASEITALLVSPARLYRNGLYEASAQNVLEEIEKKLGNEVELTIVRNSQKTCTLTNYNSAWKELEPTEYAMDSGSIYRLQAKDGKPFDISPLLGEVFIGGHNDLGYGELLVLPALDIYYRKISYQVMAEEDFSLCYSVDPNPGRRLMKKLYQSNANAVAGYLGATKGEEFVNELFEMESFKGIKAALGDDIDLEQVFKTYLDSLKESGLSALRRHHD